MQEKILTHRKNGMAILLLTLVICLASVPMFIWGAVMLETQTTVLGIALTVAGGLLMCFGWIPFLGLKVLKPQEALVLFINNNQSKVRKWCKQR